jgi:hypothetical protein
MLVQVEIMVSLDSMSDPSVQIAAGYVHAALELAFPGAANRFRVVPRGSTLGTAAAADAHAKRPPPAQR